MATVHFIDGFDYYNSLSGVDSPDQRWTVVASGFALRAGRFGGQALGMSTAGNTSNAATVRRAFPTAVTTGALGVAMTFDQIPSGDKDIIEFRKGTAIQVKFVMTSAQKLKIVNGAGTVLLSATTEVFALSTWYGYEFKVVHHASAGSVTVKVDGVQIVALTGVNTTDNVQTDMDEVLLRCRGDMTTDVADGHRYDDFYLADDFPAFTAGPRVQTVRAGSEVNVEFVPSSGTDNTAMLETPNNSATYNRSSANGALDTDELGIEPLYSDAVEVTAVGLEGVASGSGSATNATWNVQIWSGSEVTKGADVIVPSTGSLRAFLAVQNTDPDDGGAWTVERVEALRIGYDCTVLAATRQLRVQSLSLEVLMGAPAPVTTGGEVTQAAVLALDETEADLQISQLAMLVLAAPAPNIYVTQAPVMVLEATPAQIRVTQTVVMALVPGPSIARAADASFDCAAYETQCWKITREDGEVFAFTTHDEDVLYGGVTYKRCDSLKASAFSGSSASGQSTGDVQVAGLLSDVGISDVDLYAGRFDDARVEVSVVDWKTLTGRLLSRGIVTRSVQREGTYVITALTGGARLEQQPLLDVYSPICRWELGDSRCQVDIAALQIASSVTGTAAPNVAYYQHRRMFADAARVESVTTYRNGRLTWTSGLNTGLTYEVKDIVNAIVTLWQPVPFGIKVGDTYTLRPGCGKTKSECISRYNNLDNFGGFPDLPGNDAINLTPDRTE